MANQKKTIKSTTKEPSSSPYSSCAISMTHQTVWTQLSTLLMMIYTDNQTPGNHQVLQDDLHKLKDCAEKCGMQFNVSNSDSLSIKKKSSEFYLHNDSLGQPLPGPDDFQWSSLSFIRMNLQRCPKETRLRTFISLVKSLLRWGIVMGHILQTRDR